MIRLRYRACWPFMLLFVWLSGYWKIMTAIFVMMSLHEGAHALAALLLGYSLQGIDVCPFGFCARMEAMGYGSVYREMLILAAGPLMHLCYPMMFGLFASWGIISPSFCAYLIMMNRAVLLFNLLPILPLDGGRIASSLLHLLLPYAKAQRCSLLFSMAAILWVGVLGWMDNLAGVCTLVLLWIGEWLRWRQLLQDRLYFYRYRRQHPFHGRSCVHVHQDLYRMRKNYIREGSALLDEQSWLARFLG